MTPVVPFNCTFTRTFTGHRPQTTAWQRNDASQKIDEEFYLDTIERNFLTRQGQYQKKKILEHYVAGKNIRFD